MIPSFIIVHHSGSPKSTKFEVVNEYHRQLWNFKSSLGFYCGYHYFIEEDGKVYKAREENEIGAHCKAGGMNFKSVGICLAGSFEKDNPTQNQLASLQEIIERIIKDYNIPKKNILGHREVIGATTLCPGSNLLKWVEDYRKTDLSFIEERIDELQRLIKELADKIASFLKK